MDPIKEVSFDIFPFARFYKDGSIERFTGTEVAPAGFDHESGVLSKDSVIIPETGVSARLYHLNSTKAPDKKLPLLIYYHGGGFFLSSTADPRYHHSLNKLVAEANIVLVSVNYRLAPENPLPAAYEDSWDALKWVAAHAKDGGGNEVALKSYANFDQVYLAGDSSGANIAHHLALRLNDSQLGQELKIQGIAMIHPYFLGKDPLGIEVIDHVRKSMVDNWWMAVCPSEKGCDDPLINPFTDESPSLKGLACSTVIVIVAEKDIMKDRGKMYYEKLVSSERKGTADIMETNGEDHLFHIFDPNCENAKNLFKRLACFINGE